MKAIDLLALARLDIYAVLSKTPFHNRVKLSKVDTGQKHNRDGHVSVCVNIVAKEGTLSGFLHHTRTKKLHWD